MVPLIKEFKMSSVAVLFVIAFSFARCQDPPKNAVVIGGTSSVTLSCSKDKPFRWYRYLPSNRNEHKLIYTGAKLADDADKRFGVFKMPDEYPYERLDLSIRNVQPDLAGTYKCQASNEAYCAELIVLHSEPVCEFKTIHENGSEGIAEISCSFKVTSNGEPEMLCRKDSDGVKAETNCTMQFNKTETLDVVCSADVSEWLNDSFTCAIRINHRPLQRYRSCYHSTNKPEYSYTRRFQSTDFGQTTGGADIPTAIALQMNESVNCQDLLLMIEIGFPVSGAIILILIIVVVCLTCRIMRRKGDPRYESKARKISTTEPAPTTYTPLSFQQYEEIPAATYMSANPQFVASPYESMRRT